MSITQLVSINAYRRCVPARHALVCSRGDGVLQTPPFLSQVKTPVRCSKTTSCLSSFRLATLETPCNQHGRIELPYPTASAANASSSLQTTLSKLPRPPDLCTPALLLSG